MTSPARRSSPLLLLVALVAATLLAVVAVIVGFLIGRSGAEPPEGAELKTLAVCEAWDDFDADDLTSDDADRTKTAADQLGAASLMATAAAGEDGDATRDDLAEQLETVRIAYVQTFDLESPEAEEAITEIDRLCAEVEGD